jgi:hypothetical protein
LRGGRGGGAVLDPARVPPTPASAGSPFGAPPTGASGLPFGDPPRPGLSPFAGGFGGGGISRRMTNCWPIVHRFVVIQ